MVSKKSNQVTDNRVCYDCIGEHFLSSEVLASGKRRRCSYCGLTTRTFSIDEIADRIEVAFETFYERTPVDPDDYERAMLADRESDYIWYREGDDVFTSISEAAKIDEDIAKDVQEVLEHRHSNREAAEMGEETEFDSSSHYSYKGVSGEIWTADWQTFEKSLKTETRYFNTFGERLLKRVFSDVEQLRTWQGKSLIKDVGPTTKLKVAYRARAFHERSDLQTALTNVAKHLGPPPTKHAKAGRMSSSGISVFYGSDEQQAAISEVRPPVGSIVAVAKFRFLRNLRLLDLKSLKQIKPDGSIFDPEYALLVSRVSFLRELCDRIVTPVLPNDEPTEYLITQAIADYLAGNEELNLDGIMFPSIQKDKKAANIVLFHKSSRVKELMLIPGTRVSASLEEYDPPSGFFPYYQIQEEIPNGSEEPYVLDKTRATPNNPDPRLNTLEIDVDSIEIHHTKAVEYKTEKHEVYRYQHARIKFEDLKDI